MRYPNFAALAARGTWFKNAHTTYDSTTRAIPEVLDGKLPRKSSTPNFVGHPDSIYTLLGRRGYRVVNSEEATSVCPPRYCPGASRRRPAILPLLQSGRRERLERFFSAIKPGRPTLYLKHVLLPHGPYLFLPSGKQTRRTFRDPLPGMNGPVGFGDRGLTDHNQQRLLLQIAFADREIGRLFARMKANGSYDQSLIAITADHGFAFEVGVRDRRTATRRNIDEIAPVPMFIKAPGQRRGRTSAAYARTIDLVPTIADILNVRMSYRADGRSAFSRAVRGPPLRAHAAARPERHDHGVGDGAWRGAAARWSRAKLRKFGSGDFASLYTGIGPNRRLLGRLIAQLRPAAAGKVRTQIANASDMRNVNPKLGGPLHPGGRIPDRGQARRQARPGRGGERADRGREPHVPPARLHARRATP